MGQAGGAQREPSMEEILASIRRIIEDSDAVQPATGGEPARREADAGVQGDASREVDAFRAEFDEPAPRPASPALSMAEIQASVAGASEAEPRPAPAVSAEIRPFRNEAVASTLETEAAAADHHEDASGRAFEPEPETAAAPASDALGEPVSAENRPAIISDQTSRQVAAAFGELSDAFAASRRRSFDEMAEEMLRPMLRDWLDNNLPTLVEKLVREEIERVARGG